MSNKDKSVEELKELLAKMKTEQELVDARVDWFPGEIKILEKKLKEAEFKRMNAEDYLEIVVDRFEMAKGRKEQLVGIIDGLKKEIESR